MEKDFSELIAEDFSGRVIPCNIYYYKEIDSTNDEAFRLASLGTPDGALVISDSQAKGKGRFGRKWISPPFLNILASLILKPQMNQIHTPKITVMASLGVAKGIEKITGLNPKIKWPNDILLSNKKFCGILTEVKGRGGDYLFGTVPVIVGIGINVNMNKNDFPADLKDKATSLKIEIRKEIDRFIVLQSILNEIDELYSTFKQDGFERIISEWKSYTEPFFGQRVCVSLMNEKKVDCSPTPTHFRGYPGWVPGIVPNIIEGVILDIDKDGNLILRNDEGMIYTIAGGEPTIL